MPEDREREASPVEDIGTARPSPAVLSEETDARTGWSLMVWEDGTVTAR